MLFADAVHFLHNVHPGCLWAKRGKRPALCANWGRSRYSVLGSYSAIDGQYVGVASAGMINAQTVIAWIDALEAAFPDAPTITVYVDNARYFHARFVGASRGQARRLGVLAALLAESEPDRTLMEVL